MMPRLHQHAWMDADIAAFRDAVRRYVDAEIAPHVADWRRQGHVPREVWRGFGAMGFLLPELPEQWGGAGAPLAYQMVVTDELARAEVSGTVAVHTIAAHYILDYGTPEQQARWLPRLARGELLAGIAMTEPGAGSDLKAVRTRARRDGDDYVVDGSKVFITNGHSANLLVLVVRTGGEGSKGVSLLVAETEGLPGFQARILEKIGMHASDTCELFFDGMRVPAANLLGGVEGQGFAQLMSQLPYERTLLAVGAAAAIDLAVALTLDHVKQRQAFGGTLWDLQTVRFTLAEVATQAHVVRSFVNDCIQRLHDGTLDDSAAFMAKWWTTEQQCQVTDRCLQLFGGYGYMAETPIARLFADARVQKIYGGANEIMKDLIARTL
ncbi:acyl-CoA dehydrogenase family protein [Ideonella alba]|uniref:Acyl-[acyl-carrier-protein] dehydrogenase MbtN n=1 Tax=Ideonella alba TaxID=2824118 RepID=A0A940YEF3_9BURK|nr:acyl-CoA dehydrogenase family protein [Ideonella alba]MBQ0932678.1 acyl-CoA dehydrogenase family protein [Ideonella alba]